MVEDGDIVTVEC